MHKKKIVSSSFNPRLCPEHEMSGIEIGSSQLYETRDESSENSENQREHGSHMTSPTLNRGGD